MSQCFGGWCGERVAGREGYPKPHFYCTVWKGSKSRSQSAFKDLREKGISKQAVHVIIVLSVETQGGNTRRTDASARNASWRKQRLRLNKEWELAEHWVRGGKVSPTTGRATVQGRASLGKK